MTITYPITVDTLLSIPKVADITSQVKAADHNTLVDGILAIEIELGANPSGTFGTVKDRLDSLGAFIDGLDADDVALTDTDGYYSSTNLETGFLEVGISVDLIQSRLSNLENRRKYIYKPTNENRALTTTRVIDGSLLTTLEANSVYYVKLLVHISTTSGTPGIKAALNATLVPKTSEFTTKLYDGATGVLLSYGGGGSGVSSSLGIGTSLFEIEGSIETNAGGSIFLEWAQNTSSATVTTIKRGSFLYIDRIS